MDVDDLGPVEYLVVDVAPGVAHLERSLALELSRLVEAELIRVLVALLVAKGDHGEVVAVEPAGPDLLAAPRTTCDQLAELLAVDDLRRIADQLAPGATAGVVVWENTWAAPFASAARSRLVASGRVASPPRPADPVPATGTHPALEPR